MARKRYVNPDRSYKQQGLSRWRMFNGRKYEFYRVFFRKDDAQTAASQRRRFGKKCARVVRVGRGGRKYALYVTRGKCR